MFSLGAAVPPTDLAALGELFKDDKAVKARISAYAKAAQEARDEIEALKVARAQVDAMRSQQEIRLAEREEAFAADQQQRLAELAKREQHIAEIERAIGAFTDHLDRRWWPDVIAVQRACEKAQRVTESLAA